MVFVGLSEGDLKNFGGPLEEAGKIWGEQCPPWHPPSSAPVCNILYRKCVSSKHYTMYASQLWCNSRKSCMQRLRVAYNFGCRALYNLPWRASVSNHQVQCNIPTFEALLRKYKYLFLERCRKSNNIWLRALMHQIICIRHYSLNTTIAFYSVIE